jgi:plastocyanin
MPRLRIFAAVAVLALVAVACRSNETNPSSSGTTPAGSNSPSGSASPLVNKGTADATTTTEKIEIEMDNEGTSEFYFKPTFFKVKPGQIVTIDLRNEGDLPHNFSITSLNKDVTVESGKEEDTNITFPASGGDIQFFCKFHVSSGMRGAFFFGSSPQAAGAPVEGSGY